MRLLPAFAGSSIPARRPSAGKSSHMPRSLALCLLTAAFLAAPAAAAQAARGCRWRGRRSHHSDRRQPRSRPVPPPGGNARLLRREAKRHGRRNLARRRLVHRNPRALPRRGWRQAHPRLARMGPRRDHQAQGRQRHALRPADRGRLPRIRRQGGRNPRRQAWMPSSPSATSTTGAWATSATTRPITALAAFQQIFAMLKPGGVLGIEDHRLPESADAAARAHQRLHQDLDRHPPRRTGRVQAGRPERDQRQSQGHRRLARTACGPCRPPSRSRTRTAPNMPRSAKATG